MSTNARNKVAITTVRFTQGDIRRARAAARKLGLSFSSFVTASVALRAAQVYDACPTCGREHKAA